MFNALIDTRLCVRIGEPDEAARSRISAQLEDALRSRLGDLLGDGPFDVETIDRVAPWARDLARGLHWQAMYGRADTFEPRTVVTDLAEGSIDPALAAAGASTVATAWALTWDRVVDQIHGHQAHKRHSTQALLQLAPWQDSVLIGYGIHLVMEWLRLDPRLRAEVL